MPLKTLYLVTGSTGTYDDHTTWNVAAYYTEAAALEHARLALEAAQTVIGQSSSEYYVVEPTRYDLCFSAQDGFVAYRVSPIPLVTGAIPESGLFNFSPPQCPEQTLVPGTFAAKLGAALCEALR